MKKSNKINRYDLVKNIELSILYLLTYGIILIIFSICFAIFKLFQ